MNKLRLLLLANAIEGGALLDAGIGFNMGYWEIPGASFDNRKSLDAKGRECGTAACIGGSAQILFGEPHQGEDDVAHLLGLTAEQGHALFYPRVLLGKKSWEKITPKQAAHVIRKMVKDNNPVADWSLDIWRRFH